MKSTLILCLLLCVSGCSNKAAYQNLQLNKQQQCMRGPAAEYDKCMQGMDQSYEEYERQRREAIEQ
ncbi:hypothetical protein [Rheinheimera sp. NSM]|uniref:hypothetical protein n=1 Tax=Rheinheimera sp. NSM TaxID=3457884 RepID=UPI004036A89D